MKNITLAVEEDILDAVRVYAAKRQTTVNAIVREEFGRIAKADDRKARARRRLLELSEQSSAQMGPVTWTREELYER
jgi:hypothetical protein